MKTHLSLNVSNVEKSIDFYSKMFGVGPVKVKTDYAKFDLESPSVNFTMNEVPFTKGGSLSHLGLQVGSTDEVVAISDRWKAAGLETLEQMKTDCCYALQDKVWVQDPDGNRWEVFTVLGNTGDETADVRSCCGPVCETDKIGQSKSVCC